VQRKQFLTLAYQKLKALNFRSVSISANEVHKTAEQAFGKCVLQIRAHLFNRIL